jgi:hypothetical protein
MEEGKAKGRSIGTVRPSRFSASVRAKQSPASRASLLMPMTNTQYPGEHESIQARDSNKLHQERGLSSPTVRI